jgi:dTDP-4-amino-4,6-dideoxygalactose transaminase
VNRIPLLDICEQQKPILEEIQQAVFNVIKSGKYILGPAVEAFEKDILAFTGTKYAVGVSSGTDALLMSLMAANIGPGDEVITTPYTFFATAGCISRVGARPVFVDIERDSFNIDPTLVKPAITQRTKAIIPVHLFGQCADMDPLLVLAEEHNLIVIEDAAQSLGATYQGKSSGSMGHFGCYSFFPSKNLGCIGDGGLVATNDETFYQKLKILRTHGSSQKYNYSMIGGNFRLDAIQAAVASVKMKYLNQWVLQRQKTADFYTTQINKTALKSHLIPPYVCKKTTSHVFNQYVLDCKTQSKRQALQKLFSNHGIGNAIYYPIPLHLQPCFKNLKYGIGDFPNSENAANHTLAIPIQCPSYREVWGIMNKFTEVVRQPNQI